MTQEQYLNVQVVSGTILQGTGCPKNNISKYGGSLKNNSFFQIFSNISNIYQHIMANRADVRLKCNRSTCEKIRQKMKTMNKKLKLLESMNITKLEELASSFR